jgi:hypothetical protein
LALQTTTAGGSATTALTIDTSQNIGIGTTSPQSLFNTASTGQVQIGTASWPTNFVGKSNARTIVGNEGILLLWNEATASAGNEAAIIIGPKGSGTNGSTIIAGGAIKGVSESSSTNAGALTFSTNGGTGNGERMRIDSSGNVGIGTNSPSFPLDVGPASGTTTNTVVRINGGGTAGYGPQLRFSSAGTLNATLGTDQAIFGGSSTDFSLYATTGNGMRFYTGGTTERMRIDTSGNVGIGTNSPNATLAVRSAVTGGNATMRLRGTDTTARLTRLQLEDYLGTLADGLIDFVVPTAGTASSALLKMGVNGAAITMNANGYVTTPYQPAFYATRSTSTTVASGAAVLFDSAPLNQSSSYNTATGRFTAPVAGTYHFSAVILASSLSAGDFCEWALTNQSGNGALMGRMHYQANYTGDTGYMWQCASVTYYMSAGDYFQVINNSGATRGINNSAWVNFSGFLIG